MTRADEVIRASHQDDPVAKNFLTFAVEALQSVEQAKRFIEEYSDERRLFGITALGRMNYTDSQSAKDAILALAAALSAANDDVVIANILIAAFGIRERVPEIGDAELIEIAKSASTKPSPAVHNASARILTQYWKTLTSPILAFLFENLKSIDVSHKTTIQTLDVGLSFLLNGPLAEQAIDFVTTLFSSKQGELKLSEFHAFGQSLLDHEMLFHRTLVRWLLSGELPLCEGIEELVRSRGVQEKPLNLPTAEMNLKPGEQFFLCRKAIGYFFFQPVVASSILLAVLRSCPTELVEPIQNLLFDPLLRNYGGKIREYLEGIGATDPLYQHVQLVLSRANEYIEGVKSTGIIKELHPSESQRQTVHVRDADMMRKAQKDAMEKSVLLSLVHRSVILYGRSTLTTVVDPGNKRRFLEMKMSSHSVQLELPRMEIIDPVGLDHILRVFRVERLIT